MINDDWITSGRKFEYRYGFSSIRSIVLDGDNNCKRYYNIICTITASNLNKPLFKCAVFCSDIEKAQFIASNLTLAVRKVLEYLNFKTKKRWNGNDFFGINRKDIPDSDPPQHGNNQTDSVNTVSCLGRQSTFLKVVSFGTPNLHANFQYTVGTKTILLQPGYESIRQIFDKNKNINLHCKIEKTENGLLPMFHCFTTEDKIIDCKATKITTCVKSAFDLLGISMVKKWSGYDFYGLLRMDVVNVISSHPLISTQNEKDKLFSTDSQILQSAAKVRCRMAGPTSSLSSKQARNKRNGIIHELVKFASFNDVKGDFEYFIIK